MPGVFGLVGSSLPVGEPLARMGSRMRHHPWYLEQSYANDQAGVGLGRMALGFIHPEAQPAFNAERTLAVVSAGGLLDVPPADRAHRGEALLAARGPGPRDGALAGGLAGTIHPNFRTGRRSLYDRDQPSGPVAIRGARRPHHPGGRGQGTALD